MSEVSLVLLKPECHERSLTGEIIQRFERKGLKMVRMKFLTASKDILHKHYEEHKGKPFFEPMIERMIRGPITAIVFEGDDVVSQIRTLVGKTKPEDAEPGTIRFDYGMKMEFNLVHASDSVESGRREATIWFNDV